ncbi:pro-adrenomedullin-like [Pangasianodon hypophthalmus]|uniref:pro-adrenomedullin-like n=1 Tax=Pangasianodon hypophthalmus TaxID=310915 RepID=UPI000EFE6DA4|nr:pro-adrenomedullin-like [Pangasianodon hypophthalmus]XP_034161153.1 pro-adrenomedullin-like [Pangasianodon hypophthalmus]
MKTVFFRSILIWCLLVAFVPCATFPSNSDREKKMNVALQERDLGVPKRSIQDSVELLAQQENRNMGTPLSQSSDHLSGRGKRGCNLLTCSVHDLAYRISQLSNKMNNAPLHKISPCGYGRRRRRSLLQRSTAPTHGDCHLRHDSPQKLT